MKKKKWNSQGLQMIWYYTFIYIYATKKLLELINKFSKVKVTGYKINIQKYPAFLSTNNEKIRLYPLTLFLDMNSQYYQNDDNTQSNAQSQCNSYQVINYIFHRSTKKKNHNFYGNTEDWNSQSNLDKQKQVETSTYMTSSYTTKLQSSRQYGSVQFSSVTQ